MKVPAWTLSLAAVVMSGVLASVPVARAEGPDACIGEAQQDFKDCKAGCRESFQLTKDTCANRDHACVESCRADRSTCRQPIVDALNASLAQIQSDLDDAKTTCRQLYADGTPERDTCIDNAQVVAFVQRHAARKAAHPGLNDCRKAFKNCVRTNCPPLATPDPEGVAACKDDAKDVFGQCVADCTEDKQLAKDTCLDRDHACVEVCRAGRSACLEDPLATRAADIAACQATRDTAIANCPPPGDPARADCIAAAEVVAFQCRDSAREATAADIHECRVEFQACAGSCPPPGG